MGIAYERAIPVTGVGMITCAGLTAQENWQRIVSGRSGIGQIMTFPTDRYRVTRGGQIDRTVISTADGPAFAFARTAAREALCDAGVGGQRTALIVGTNVGDISSLETLCRRNVRDSTLARRSVLGELASRLARELGLTGPVLTVSAACASSACAIGTALDLIRLGHIDVALAGGVDELTEFKFSGHHQIGSMTEDEVRPFDLNRCGMLLGEGAGFVVLESNEHAEQRGAPVHAWLCGYGSSNDAHHLTASDLTGSGAALAIRRAIDDAGIAAADIEYVNAHGTATPYNDLMEARALYCVLGDRAWKIPCTSQKPIFGHLLGAASAVEAITTVFVLDNQLVPPTINHQTADGDCPVDCVPSTARPMQVEVAISNSFGFGGVNGCLVFRRSVPSEWP